MRVFTVAAALVVCAALAGCSRKPASIEVLPKRVKLYGIERPHRLTARVLDRKGEPISVGAPAWSSSNAEIVTVDATGRLLSKRAGEAVVTASFEGLSAPVAVEVMDVQSLEVSPAGARLVGPPGTEFPLTVRIWNSRKELVSPAVAWSSSDEKVARVSPEGVVTSVAAGSATMVARVGDLETVAEIRVDPREVSRVELRPATALVRIGDSQRYEVAVYDAAGAAIEGAAARFRSSDPAVASLDGAGVATGRKAGAATIRAEVGSASAEAVLLVN